MPKLRGRGGGGGCDDEAASDIFLDISKCMEMAVVHDLAESIVGDIAPSDGVSKSEKEHLEREAMKEISATLDVAYGDVAKRRLLKTFEEYEHRSSPEALAVKDLDLLDMIVQADEYETAHPNIDLGEFFRSTDLGKFKTRRVQQVATELYRQRDERAQGRQRKVKSGDANSSAGLNGEVEDSMGRHESGNFLLLSPEDDAFITKFTASEAGRDISPVNVETVLRALRIHEGKC